jgi:molybdopterin-guanine dinucleotide biosynthesis protein A
MKDIEGFILAGGLSSRMGRDKALLPIGCTSFLGEAMCAVGIVARRVRVVGSRPGIKSYGLPVVDDIYEGAGALGGIHAALSACETRWAAVIACDLPFVTSELFARLAPLQEDGRPQPLCALYAADACLDAAEELMRTGDLRPRALLQKVRTRWVTSDELSDLEGAPLFFTNVNTPADYEEALREVERSWAKGKSEEGGVN